MWQKFNQLLELLRDNQHNTIIPELEQFQLKLVDLVSDREKYLNFSAILFGGKDLTLETINKYQSIFVANDSDTQHYPDYWNDLGTFNLIKSRGLLMKAMTSLKKRWSLRPV